MSVKIKPKQPQKRLQCQYCKEKIENDNYYLCDCGYQMCWDCYDDFQDNQDPYCPKCDAELISDSEDEQITKPKSEPPLSKSTSVQNQSTSSQIKSSPSGVNKSSSSVAGTTNSANSTITSSSINTSGFNYSDLAKVRVIKKNLVYVIGLAPEIANEETLLKKEYFSQYGKITKIVVNTNNAYNPKGPNGPSYSAYITYSSEREASMAILGTEEFQINERTIRASYGTTKYCSYFLKQQECPNLPDCLYLHSFGKDKEFFQKDEATSNKNIFIDQQKMAIKNIQKYIPDLVKIKNTPVTYNSVLPTPLSVIERLIEQDVLDIKQKPVEQNSNDQKGDKKKKEDNTPLIDQWSIDFSIPQTAPKKDKEDSRKQEATSPTLGSRKQSKSISEKDLNTTNPQSASKSPSQSQQNTTQPEITQSSSNKIQDIEKPSIKPQINGSQQQNEEKPFSKEEFIMKAMNEILQSPSRSHSSSLSNSNTHQALNQNTPQTSNQQKTQTQTSQNNSQINITNNSNSNSNISKAASQPVAEQTNKKVEKSPIKEQPQKQDEPKREDQTETRKTENISAVSSNQSSNVASTNHSRTSSTNQKVNGQNNQTQNQSSNTNGAVKNAVTQNGSYADKKEASRKEQSESKYQKNQYIPVNQSTKQSSQSIEPQKEINQQTQNILQQQHQSTPNPSQQNSASQKEENKQSKSSTAPQQKQQNNNSQTLQQQQNEKTNGSLSQSKQQNTLQNGLQQQNQNNQNILTPHHSLSFDNTAHSINPHASIQPHHQHTVSEPVAPKYILQKVEKREKTLSSDNQIMKRLITRTTHQKNASSRFDFAKNSENCDQPVEEVDVINHIFNGQYIILTKSYSQNQSNFDKSEY